MEIIWRRKKKVEARSHMGEMTNPHTVFAAKPERQRHPGKHKQKLDCINNKTDLK
jgi:hypothetical protein